MKNFQKIVIWCAVASLFTILVYVEGKCHSEDPDQCITERCIDAHMKPCVWNKPRHQCQCPHQGGDNCVINDVQNQCLTPDCVNKDQAQVACIIETVPGLLMKKVCKCPLTCVFNPATNKCDTDHTCGDPERICDKGFKNETCRCLKKCDTPCNYEAQDCQDGCVCTQITGQNGQITNLCKPQVLDSPCDCTKDKCDSKTDLVCKSIKPDTEPNCGVCKIGLGDGCCEIDSDCAEGACNGNKKCKLTLDSECDPENDQCDNNLDQTCQLNTDFEFTCQ